MVGTEVRLYAGAGAGPGALAQARAALILALPPSYRVRPIDARSLRDDAWEDDAALLVFPGGRAQPYARDLAGVANDRIAAYVANGGRYLGLCAGGYYGARRVAFAPQAPGLRVVARRPLGFYPGLCRGPTGPDFSYGSEQGARAVALTLVGSSWRDLPRACALYDNGGGAFLGAGRFDNVAVLARYTGQPRAAAIVSCEVGRGLAVLTGIHPEMAVAALQPEAYAPKTWAALQAAEATRLGIWQGLLGHLGLVP